MQLFHLIQSNHWLSVASILLSIYPDQKDLIDRYQEVYEKLNKMEHEDNKQEIILTEVSDDFDEDNDEDHTYIDVSGRDLSEHPPKSYAIEFVEWKKWLRMEIAEETIQDYSELEIIAHCLYEMTFVGFDEKEIQSQLKSLEDTAKEYENMTEEEREKNTFSWEDIKKEMEEEEDDDDEDNDDEEGTPS